jgi:ABC-2 type transport system ATP-binding protein
LAGSAVIQLIGVGKRYGRGPLVVAGVDAEIRGGAPLVVLGANGSGKSTLLRLVAGCLAPTHGRVVGRPATVGYVPDRFPGRLRMPVGAYLRHLRRIRPGRAFGSDPVALLGELGFRGGLRVPMNQLSKGNAQKVGLAQALCSGAPLLVLDEPWSGLDVDTRPVLTAVVEHAVAAGVAVVVTDHTGIAETLTGHQAVFLRQGRLADAGPHTVAITLRCAEPERVVRALAGRGSVERQAGELVLRVPAQDVDALLITALHIGCSVREVRP